MRIGVFYENEGLPNMDLSRPDLGNPGVGGTQYCFLLLLFYLKKYRPNWQLIAYRLLESKFPSGIQQKYVCGYQDLVNQAFIDNCDFIIIKAKYDNELIKAVKTSKIPIIFWGHNYYLAPLADFISSTRNIVANVFVGKQQYDRYIDHDIIFKSISIFNMIPDPFNKIERSKTSMDVVYMGSLTPEKGFHLLAKIWKDIIKEVPDAKLKVIGGGNLYSRNTKLGPLGIADIKYEETFIKYLTEKESCQLMPSVEFLGVLGKEKYEIFKNASVGVVNPSGRTETFGMGIVEMGFCELPVVTLNVNGHPDTVINGITGILENNLSGIKKSIILLLKNRTLNYRLGKEAKLRTKRVAPENIVPKWIELIEGLKNGNETKLFHYKRISSPYLNNFKLVRVINRFIRYKLGIKIMPSLISIESYIHSKVIK